MSYEEFTKKAMESGQTFGTFVNYDGKIIGMLWNGEDFDEYILTEEE